MSARGSDRSYRFGRKNNWRRTLWNDVLSRTFGRESSEGILYLAGPEDNDRKIATSKGVPSHNMVAIDRAANNVKAVREAGGYAVTGDVLDVLAAWPDSRPVCAVVLDYCGGIPNIDRFLRLLGELTYSKAFADATVAINLLRGRDSASGRLRRLAAGAIAHFDLARGYRVDALHRGLTVLVSASLIQVAWASGFIEGEVPDAAARADLDAKLGDRLWWAAPSFYSYRSGRLVYDSVVFQPSAGLDAEAWQLAEIGTAMDKGYPLRREIVGSIRATMAVRSRRLL